LFHAAQAPAARNDVGRKAVYKKDAGSHPFAEQPAALLAFLFFFPIA
jgi:hypothetical protein